MTITWTCWRDPSHTPISTTRFGWPQCSVCRAAPPYHERPDYLPDGFVLGIYVFADRKHTCALVDEVPGDPLVIRKGSAIVGLSGEGESDRTDVYYEGWIHGPMQYADRDARGLWEAGVEQAASRMVMEYPTIAQAHLPSETLKQIGSYHPKTRQVTVDDEEALDAWLNQ